MNPTEHLPPTQVRAFAEIGGRLAGSVSSIVLGKPEVVRLAITALLAEGHVLLEDVPGVGKTTLARAVAASVRGQWRRVQFTPDLLPADVTGVTIFNQGTQGFEFHPGPVFANIVIADEINRASPKTQSALLEVMEERYVTVDGVRHPVPRPFLVVATQNPVEMDGTYRLPEAQLDRFLMKLSVGYPDEAAEVEVLRGAAHRSPDALTPVTDTATIGEMIRFAHGVHVADRLYAYAVRLATATRTHPQVRLGVSPRGVIALTRAAGVYALLDGRGFVLPEDFKALVGPVFAHRILLSADAALRGVTTDDVLRDALTSVPVPLLPSGSAPPDRSPGSPAIPRPAGIPGSAGVPGSPAIPRPAGIPGSAGVPGPPGFPGPAGSAGLLGDLGNAGFPDDVTAAYPARTT